MTAEWKDITDPEELFRLRREGWEIEVQVDAGNDKYCPFKEWNQTTWSKTYLFRARPRQPKIKKVKLFAYIGTSILAHVREDSPTDILKAYDGVGSKWIRQPHLDLEGEIPNDN